MDGGGAGCAFTRVLRGPSTRFTGGRAEEQPAGLSMGFSLFSDVASTGGARRLCGRLPDSDFGAAAIIRGKHADRDSSALLHKDRTTMMKGFAAVGHCFVREYRRARAFSRTGDSAEPDGSRGDAYRSRVLDSAVARGIRGMAGCADGVDAAGCGVLAGGSDRDLIGIASLNT